MVLGFLFAFGGRDQGSGIAQLLLASRSHRLRPVQLFKLRPCLKNLETQASDL